MVIIDIITFYTYFTKFYDNDITYFTKFLVGKY